MKSRPTIADVAKAAGVSRSTVSLVLADSNQIPARTKGRVREAMEEVGYVYNRLAGIVRGGKSQSIGLLMTNIRNPYFAELIMSVDETARDSHYTIISGFSFGNFDREREILLTMLESQVDGLIILAADDSDRSEFNHILTGTSVPIVMILRRIPGTDFDFVGVEERKSGYLLGSHLSELGVRTAAFLGGVEDSRIRSARTAGLRESLGDEVLPPQLLIPAKYREYGTENGTELIDALLEKNSVPDAIIAYNDSFAAGIYRGLRARGISPGHDIAVGSFDNIPSSRILTPELTTVDTDPQAVGRLAVTKILDRIEARDGAEKEVLVEPTLVVRQSTKLWIRSALSRPH